MTDEIKNSEVTESQIEKWKLKHGDVFVVKSDGKKGYLRKPDRKTMAFAMSKAATNPMESNEIIINNCWLGGDDDLKDKNEYFFGLSAELEKLIEIKKVELKKL